MQLRRNTQIKNLATTLARDPEGTSRIPKETFQQVFDRMEQSLRGKKFTWPTVCEYFTKRGRPLTNDEIRQLRQEDELMEQQRQYEAD